jgi:uncharacterized protein (DUF58 family)
MPDYRKYLDPHVLAKISRLELRARMVVEGFISGMHKSPYQGFSVEFATHRVYVPGDDIRHIDWRLHARSDRLYIKQYEEETNLLTHVLLDCSNSMAYPSDGALSTQHSALSTSAATGGGRYGRMSKFDYACTIAASLIYMIMHQQDACGLLMFDHAVREQIPPTSHTGQLRAMIELIERHPPDSTTEVKMLFTELAERLKKRSLIIVISDLLTNVDDLILGLQRLRYTKHDVIVLHVMDHDELEFPFADNSMFKGLEAPDLELLTDPQSLRATYLEIVQAFISRIRAACVDHKIDYRLISTREPLDAALSAFLAARMHAMAR